MTPGGFSHVGVSTHDMDATIDFWTRLLGFPKVAENCTRIRSGGTLRQVYFDIGDEQFVVFMEPRRIEGIRDDYETNIGAALGVPHGMYHFAFKVATLEALEARRDALLREGLDVSAVIDLGHARSVFLADPNGLQLEFCWHSRQFDVDDLHQVSDADIARAG